jgi:hypothetical protein
MHTLGSGAAGDKAVLETVQEKDPKQMVGLGGESYEERCKEAKINTLERRRYLQHMAKILKIIKGINKINSENLFQLAEGGRTRATVGHLNLLKKHARTEIRRNSYAYGVVDQWNQLPDKLKETEKVETFKKNLRKMGDRPIGGQ